MPHQCKVAERGRGHRISSQHWYVCDSSLEMQEPWQHSPLQYPVLPRGPEVSHEPVSNTLPHREPFMCTWTPVQHSTFAAPWQHLPAQVAPRPFRRSALHAGAIQMQNWIKGRAAPREIYFESGYCRSTNTWRSLICHHAEPSGPNQARQRGDVSHSNNRPKRWQRHVSSSGWRSRAQQEACSGRTALSAVSTAVIIIGNA